MFDESEVESVLARLVRSPSTQTERFEADPGIQSYLRETVAGAAIDLGLEPYFDSMGNLVVRVGHGRGRALIFAYGMTHPANRMPEPFSPTVRLGPGCSTPTKSRSRSPTWHSRPASTQLQRASI